MTRRSLWPRRRAHGSLPEDGVVGWHDVTEGRHVPWALGLGRGHRGELASDCEAFLDGRLAEQFEQRGQPVPVWAWTNLLAHGTEEDLASERTAPSPHVGGVDGRWWAARSYLAGSVLDASVRSGGLEALQARVLVPLELELSSRSEVERWDRRRWVSTVEAAVRSVTSSRRPPEPGTSGA